MDHSLTREEKVTTTLGATTKASNFVLPEERSLTDRFMSMAVRMMVQEGHRRGEIIRHMVGACCGMLAAEDEMVTDALIDGMKDKVNEIRVLNFKKNRFA